MYSKTSHRTLWLSLPLIACASPTTDEAAFPTEGSAAAVTASSAAASTFPWAGKAWVNRPVDSALGACGGALIAPRVAITAAHCISESGAVLGGERLELPLAPGKPAVSVVKILRFKDEKGHLHTGLETGPNGVDYVDFKQHDIALLILQTPIKLDRYPQRSTSAQLTRPAYLLGPIGGTDANPIVTSPFVTLETKPDTPFHYVASNPGPKAYGAHGDSGSPWVAKDTDLIVGIASGTANSENTQTPSLNYVYRIDKTACWIAHNVVMYGGEGPQGRAGVKPALSQFCH